MKGPNGQTFLEWKAHCRACRFHNSCHMLRLGSLICPSSLLASVLGFNIASQRGNGILTMLKMMQLKDLQSRCYSKQAFQARTGIAKLKPGPADHDTMMTSNDDTVMRRTPTNRTTPFKGDGMLLSSRAQTPERMLPNKKPDVSMFHTVVQATITS